MGAKNSHYVNTGEAAAFAAAKDAAVNRANARVGKCGHTPRHKQYALPIKPAVLNDLDYEFLVEHTGKTHAEIQDIFSRHNLNKEDPHLDKQGFINIYQELRHESEDHVADVAEFVFRAFDNECTGYITFNEFLVAYALTCRADMRKKLVYAFELYDVGKQGLFKKEQLRDVITGMCDLLGINRKLANPAELVEKTINEVHTNAEGNITKDNFINGLMQNADIRALLSPFSLDE